MTMAFTPSSSSEERERLKGIADRLAQAGGEVELLLGHGADAQRVTLSPPLAQLLRTSAQELGEGHTVSLVVTEEEVTPARAAKLLGISRPHLVNTLLRTGQLPYRMVGRHHRIAMADLLAYQRAQEERQRAADDLTRLSEELGLYDFSGPEPTTQ